MSHEERPENKLKQLLRRRRRKRIATTAALLAALPLGGYLAWQQGWLERLNDFRVGGEEPVAALPAPTFEAPEREADPPETPAVAAAPPPGEPSLELPSLDASDAFVRAAAATLAKHPDLARWLANEDLVRRFVAAVDNVAEGRSPRRHLDFLAPAGSFLVLGDPHGGETLLADPMNEWRYDAIVGLVEAIDPADGARLYTSLEPLLQQAFEDLGYPEEHFEKRLKAAAWELLATPILPDPPELRAQVKRFEYADPALEHMSDAQKHLLRMGPRNVDRVQRKVRDFLRAIDPEWSAPPIQVYRSPAPGEGSART